MKQKKLEDRGPHSGMSPHFILRVLRGEGEWAKERLCGCGKGDGEMVAEREARREVWKTEEKGSWGESGENPEQDGGRRGQTPGARRLFSPNWQQARAPAEEKCVYPVTQIPLCLCTLCVCVVMCACVCGTPAEECDQANSGCDWSWSPLAPGWMTMQSQKPEQCLIHPLNTSYCKSYWNNNNNNKKNAPRDLGMIHRVGQTHSFLCATLGRRAHAKCAKFTRVWQINCGGRSSAFAPNIDPPQPS